MRVDRSNFRNLLVGEKQAIAAYAGQFILWEKPWEKVTHTNTGIYSYDIPSWVSSLGFAMIGGGGGGQTGNGGNRSDGRPGAASQWEVFYHNLGHPAVRNLHIIVGDGGSGGSNNDHAAGSNGGNTLVNILRNAGSAGIITDGSYTVRGGQGGPQSNLPQSSNGGSPRPAVGPRALEDLPVGRGGGESRAGTAPGAGGGYGMGGIFGRRNRGGNGADGRVIVYMFATSM